MNTVNKLIKWLKIDEENDEKNSKLEPVCRNDESGIRRRPYWNRYV